MINSIAVEEQIVLSEKNVIFNDNQVRTRSSYNPFRGWLDYTQANGNYLITKPGVYRIHYNANLTADDKIVARLGIIANGKVLEGSQTETFITEPTLYHSLSATTLVRVSPYSTLPISLENLSEDKVTIKEASIIIDKVA